MLDDEDSIDNINHADVVAGNRLFVALHFNLEGVTLCEFDVGGALQVNACESIQLKCLRHDLAPFLAVAEVVFARLFASHASQLVVGEIAGSEGYGGQSETHDPKDLFDVHDDAVFRSSFAYGSVKLARFVPMLQIKGWRKCKFNILLTSEDKKNSYLRTRNVTLSLFQQT